jgi:hypothetical protein
MKIACCILSYNITKGMKSFGPIGLLKKNNSDKELILYQIEYLRKIFGSVDIYIVTGFGKEKLDKKILQKKYVNIIHNDEFNHKNYSYAFKLFLKHIESKLDTYQGILFLDSNILIKSLKQKKRTQSWIVAKQYKDMPGAEDFLGININASNIVEYLFYNIGHLSWCKSFYLTQRDTHAIIKNMGLYHDNMFLFEVINESIERLGLKLSVNQVASNNKEIIEINGLKDKYKVK